MPREGNQAARGARVLVADSSRIGCELLAGALKRCPYNFTITSCGGSSAEVLAAFKEYEPHVAVISANLRDGPLAGIKVLPELRSKHPQTCTIVLIDRSERDLVLEAFRKGAKGVFSREEPLKLLCKCVYKVYEGQIWMTGRELQFILEALAQTAPLRLLNGKGKSLLTKREEDVVRLVAEGFRNSEISRELGVSEHTVKNYLFRVFDKLGISSRTELVLYAMSQREPTQVPTQ